MQPSIQKLTPQGKTVIPYFNPFRMVMHLWRFRALIRTLTYREVLARYKGSFIGMGWSFLQPLLMLTVYTFVFSVVFNARWGIRATEGRGGFALTLFVGLITFGLFSEVVNAAPSLILNHVNYVKKVVFPLEILPVVRLFSALVNAGFSLIILVMGIVVFDHSVSWTVALLPLIWLPLLVFTLGCGFFLAALGVFIRDVAATVGVVTTMLFFLTPIFYPAQAVPENFRIFNALNPIALFVENARRVVLWGMLPEWRLFLVSLAATLMVCVLGFVWFMKSKRAFADVL